MKVLLSAIACHPELGSEAKVGWSTALAVSRIPEVEECHVMTHIMAKTAIAREQEAGRGEKIFFHFFEEPFKYHPSRLLARLQSWLLYRNWQRKSVDRAARLHAKHEFALTHHVTYASWRMPPPLWRLPIPFVFGPVGGGGTTPPAFRSILGPSARAFESLRMAATALSAHSTELKLCCRNSSAIVAADTATAKFLSVQGAKDVHHLCQVFFSDRDATRFKTAMPEGTRGSDALKIFAGGNLEGRKGTRLSLQALALLKQKGVPFSFTYGGWGPDLKAMKLLAHQLGIAQEVTFHEGYSGQEYAKRLTTNDVFLLPSIRETAGITMMEAVMAGCYPIVLAGTGAGDIVESTGGTAIHAKTPEEAVRQIAEKLEWCYRQRAETHQQAEAAGENMRQLYSESSYQEAISTIYKKAITNHAKRLKES
jgi:glycosyltransferase involved in cell wall biosynthesis